MINYSIAMMSNPSQKEDPKRTYGVAQYAEKMTLDQFSEHISSHGCVYDADDVKAILGKAVKWGQRIFPVGGTWLIMRKG